MSILDRECLTLKQAATLIPTRPHIATIWRWATGGCRGHVLETWYIGGQRYTSRDAIEKFLAAINGREPPLSKRRQKELERVERELKAMGI